MHPWLQFSIFIILFIAALIVGNLIAYAVVDGLFGSSAINAVITVTPGKPHFIAALWIFQILGTTIPILAAPLIYGYAISGEPRTYLKVNFQFNPVLLIVVLAIMFLFLPTVELLSNINQQIGLPHWLEWMRKTEQDTEKMMDSMLDMKTVWDMLANTFLIAFVTAIVEELMFRGVLQTIMFKWTKNIHVAIWITAILFSAFHMEFYGFFVRTALGVIFGYLVAWSGSIWPAVWAHFLNNGIDVVMTYLFEHKLIRIDPNDQHVFNKFGYGISLLAIFGLMILYRRIALTKYQAPAA